MTAFLFRLIMFLSFLLPAATESVRAEVSDFDFLEAINVPGGLVPATSDPLLIAIVDDGVQISHEDLKGFIWNNPREISGNLIDDDGNGMVDDVHGWDVADDNALVAPPKNRLAAYYHGTHLAGIIAAVLRKAYGDQAKDFVKILPIKALSDHAEKTYIKDGYVGIEYAVRTGADIILCAWSSVHISEVEERILRQARDKGILVIGSAGNFSDELNHYPAAFESVIAVTALDREGHKLARSNFGSFVDLSASGHQIASSGALSDTHREVHSGSSQAAAMVAAATVVLKIQYPNYSPDEIKAALKNSADPFEPEDTKLIGKLGAGRLNVGKAVAGIQQADSHKKSWRRPQGFLLYQQQNKEKSSWRIKVSGEIKGVWFKRPVAISNQGQGVLHFYREDNTGENPSLSYPLDSMPDKVFVSGNKVTVRFESASKAVESQWLMEYRVEPINFRTRFCRGSSYLTEEGSFDDGSGPEEYSAGTDCKWQITAPQGQVIRIRFTDFDTEAKTDFVYFFNGTGTHEKIIAIYSGPNIPPELITWTNKVLIWFVTNATNQGRGWLAEYSFEEKPIRNKPTENSNRQ